MVTAFCTPLEVISGLGVGTAMAEAFLWRREGFDWVHLGTTDLPIGTLLTLIRRAGPLLPPRTGHMGNWEEIVYGRAGMMDFNKAICAQGLGYPLIYCFNQTEASSPLSGDWVYLPGSRVQNGQRTELPLFTWNGAGFVPRGREVPLFTPLVLSEVEGSLVPLTQIHWRTMQQYGEFRFRLEASVVRDHEPVIREILHVLLEEAAQQTNSRRAFQDLMSHQVALDGRVGRAEIRCDGAGFRMGEAHYASAAELIDAAMLPFLAATEPDQFFAHIGAFPEYLPVLSNVLTGVFSAMFSTHYPGCAIDRGRMTQPFNPHFHWGARDMAGYPPRRKGYFSEKSTVKSYRWICRAIIRAFPEFDPVFLVLMPAVIFALCPSDRHPGDWEAMGRLIREVKRDTDGHPGPPDRMVHEVERLVAIWLEGAPGLSSYFRNRFRLRQGILNEGELPAASAPVEPEGFRDLTLRQACIIVGALTDALTPR